MDLWEASRRGSNNLKVAGPRTSRKVSRRRFAEVPVRPQGRSCFDGEAAQEKVLVLEVVLLQLIHMPRVGEP